MLYDTTGIDPDLVVCSVIKTVRYYTVVGLPETKVIDGRQTVRNALVNTLTRAPNLDAPDATTTHEALSVLGANRKGYVPLIIANFE